MVTPLHVAVLGAGSWGTALAALASHAVPTLLWARDPALVAQMQASHTNERYLAGHSLPATLRFSSQFQQTIDFVAAQPQGLILLGVPVAGLAEAAQQVSQALAARQRLDIPVVYTCKGVHATHGTLPHQIISAALQAKPQQLATGVLSGPSFAREVVQGLPVALTIASTHEHVRSLTTQALHGPRARVYGSTDVIGVETGGAVKNIMAIACGVADALGLGHNARAALITRGLAEMTRLGVALGAQSTTFAGLTGLGDLVLTATGDLSRNRQVGLALGQGKTLAQIQAEMSQVAEGVRCAQAVLRLASQLKVDMPITAAVCSVLFSNLPASAAVEALLAREPRTEAHAPGAPTP